MENMNNTVVESKILRCLWYIWVWLKVCLRVLALCIWNEFLMVPQCGSDSECQDWAIWNVSLLADESQDLKQKWSNKRQK